MKLCLFFLPTELIYKEVMDWEERNKNGVLKEDCLGESLVQICEICVFFQLSLSS